MAILLAQLGRFAYRRAVPVLIAWLLIAAGTVIGGIALGGTMQDSFKIPGTESQQAIDRLAAVFPQTAGASGQLVVHSTDASIADLESELDDLATRLGDVDGVDNAISPFNEYATDAISDDGMTAVVQVQFEGRARRSATPPSPRCSAWATSSRRIPCRSSTAARCSRASTSVSRSSRCSVSSSRRSCSW
ncbi:hypothetical protein GCM10025869_03410 [Homoserinibacter gongjuensis]|uniref:Membrane transport protein MMPL domain-containing protein n=1 Tax=Homoserinibacter gongjuensis TaxID=1162968 RepID=A0ABQ6JPY9_9MICO|nr:hypothetical protein GCM10025869_03410 [Homoserinibacter gongjuensis]